MKIIRIVMILLLVTAISLSFAPQAAQAGTDKTWDGGGDGVNWSDADNWSPNSAPTPSDDIIIDDDGGTDSIVTLDIDFTLEGSLRIESGDTLIIDAGVSLTIAAPYTSHIHTWVGTINNDGTINNTLMGTIDNDGNINNTFGGTINNDGIINNTHSTIYNIDWDSDNMFDEFFSTVGGTIDNDGNINNTIYGTINNNQGDINNDGTIENDGNINNTLMGTINNDGFINNNDGTINNNQGDINNDNRIDNYGTINNDSTINNIVGGNIDNDGTINNTIGGTINNRGDIYNTPVGTITNDGTIISTFGGTIRNDNNINNDGTIHNGGTFNNAEGGTIDNGGTIHNNPFGDIINDDTINNLCGAIFDNEGAFGGNPVIDMCNLPVANDDSYSTSQDTSLVVYALGVVLENDSDPDGDNLVVDSHTQPSDGSVAVNLDGSFTYTPNIGFTGDDSFNYTASDGNGGTDTALVTITVNPVVKKLDMDVFQAPFKDYAIYHMGASMDGVPVPVTLFSAKGLYFVEDEGLFFDDVTGFSRALFAGHLVLNVEDGNKYSFFQFVVVHDDNGTPRYGTCLVINNNYKNWPK